MLMVSKRATPLPTAHPHLMMSKHSLSHPPLYNVSFPI